MKWKKRKKEIARLRKKHPVVSVNPLPDLSSGKRAGYPSLSKMGVSKITARKKEPTPSLTVPDVFVGTPHKQGPMLMFREELAQGGGKKT